MRVRASSFKVINDSHVSSQPSAALFDLIPLCSGRCWCLRNVPLFCGHHSAAVGLSCENRYRAHCSAGGASRWPLLLLRRAGGEGLITESSSRVLRVRRPPGICVGRIPGSSVNCLFGAHPSRPPHMLALFFTKKHCEVTWK